MGIKFIYGRAGSGKSHYCINEIKKRIENNAINKLILLVPEQFTFQAENRLLKMIGEKSVLKAEVLSFKRMAHRVFSECGGVTHRRMNEAGKDMLLYKILEDLSNDMTIFFRASRQQGFIDIVSKTITEFKKYNITQEILNNTAKGLSRDDEDLKMKLHDLTLIFNKFNEFINENYIDPDDELTMLSKKLDHCNIYDGAEIWVDEFTTFTPQQYAVLVKLMKKVKRVNFALIMDDRGQDRGETDIFNVTNNTESKLMKLAQESRISYDGYVNINKEVGWRFKRSDELNHLERHFFSYPFKVYERENGDIRIYKANNNYDEVETIAKDIVALVRDKNYRYKDISVVCRNIEDYEKITSVIFSQYNIPYFIDKKRDVVSNPLIVLINSIFEVFTKNWSYESVFKYLKTGLTPIEKHHIDVLENYVLSNGIRGAKWTEVWWDYPVSNSFKKEEELSTEDKEKLALINSIKDEVRLPLQDFYEEVKGRNGVKDISIKLYDLLNNLGVILKIERWSEDFTDKGIQDRAKEYSQVIDIVMEVLDQAVEVMGKEKVDLGTYIKIINAGFQKHEMGLIPVALDQVNVGDVARIRGRDVKALYIVGVNDGVLPASNKEEGILSDRDRELLRNVGMELAADTKTKAFEEQFLVYTVLAIPSRYLMMSYPLADFEGKSLRPSIIIPRLKKIFPKIHEESDLYRINRNEYEKIVAPIPTFNELITALRKDFENKGVEKYWSEVYSWYRDKSQWKEKTERMVKGLTYTNQDNDVSRTKIKKLYSNDGGRLMFNVSRIEKYAQCPFAYYVQYGLKAKDRKIYEFTPPDLGNLMHEILDQFTKHVRDNNLRWNDISIEQCRNIISSLVDEEVGRNSASILNSSKRYKYFTDRFKKILTKSVTIISEHMKRSNFDIFRNEFEFGNYRDSEPIKLTLPSGDDIYLTGRIDRVDTVEIEGETYIRIIDYKSGNKNFDLNQLYYGLQVQLLVYLDALIKNSKYFLEKQVLPGAILYFRIDDPIIRSSKDLDDEDIKERILKKLKMDGLLLKDVKLVKAMDNTMETYSLIIPASFKKDGDFTKQSAVVTEEQFNVLREYVNQKMIEICEEMLSGKIKVEPSKDGSFTYCTFCDYSPICQFDPSLIDNKYRHIRKKKDEELWEDICSVVGIKVGGEE